MSDRSLSMNLIPAVGPSAFAELFEFTGLPLHPLVVHATVVLTPLNVHSSYVSVLPSGNIRFRLTDELQLRLSASKTLTT